MWQDTPQRDNRFLITRGWPLLCATQSLPLFRAGFHVTSMRAVKAILKRGLLPGVSIRPNGRIDVHVHCMRPRDPRSPQDYVASMCTREGVAVISVDLSVTMH